MASEAMPVHSIRVLWEALAWHSCIFVFMNDHPSSIGDGCILSLPVLHSLRMTVWSKDKTFHNN